MSSKSKYREKGKKDNKDSSTEASRKSWSLKDLFGDKPMFERMKYTPTSKEDALNATVEFAKFKLNSIISGMIMASNECIGQRNYYHYPRFGRLNYRTGEIVDRLLHIHDFNRKIKPFGFIQVPSYSPSNANVAILNVEDHILYNMITCPITCELTEPVNPQEIKEMALLRNHRWMQFYEDRIRFLNEYPYLIEFEIQGYYNSIDVKGLIEIVSQKGLHPYNVEILGEFLSGWDFGLPRGYATSDILADLYYQEIHQILTEEQISYTHYNEKFLLGFTSENELEQKIKIFRERIEPKFSIDEKSYYKMHLVDGGKDSIRDRYEGILAGPSYMLFPNQKPCNVYTILNSVLEERKYQEIINEYENHITPTLERNRIVSFLKRKDQQPYIQNLLLSYFYRRKDICAEIINICRKKAFNLDHPIFLRLYYQAILREHGTPDDVRNVLDWYHSSNSEESNDFYLKTMMC